MADTCSDGNSSKDTSQETWFSSQASHLTGWATFGKVAQAQLCNEKVELSYLKGPFQLLQSVILITAYVVFYLWKCWHFMDCHRLSFLVVLMTQDSWIHEAVNCEYLEREVVTCSLTQQGKAYLLMKCVNCFATIVPIRAFAWLHCSPGNAFPMALSVGSSALGSPLSR